MQSPTCYKRPPSAIADLIDAVGVPWFKASPCGRFALIAGRPHLPDIADIAREELKLAGIRFDPKLRLSSSKQFYTGPFVIRDLTAANPLESDITLEGLPTGAGLQCISWSDGGNYLAFLLRPDMLKDKLEIWVAEMGHDKNEDWQCQAFPVEQDKVPSGVTIAPVKWIRSTNKLLCSFVPDSHGEAPITSNIPDGPQIETSDGTPSPARTYQDLIKTNHDESAFEYYTRSSLCVIDVPSQKKQTFGSADGHMYRKVQFSPDGTRVLVEVTKRPFSHLVPYSRFGRSIRVWMLSGPWGMDIVEDHTVMDIQAAESIPISFDARAQGPRNTKWNESADADLVFTEALDGGDPKMAVGDGKRDALYTLCYPYDYKKKKHVFATKRRISSVIWTLTGDTLVQDRWRKDRSTSMWFLKQGTTTPLKIPQFDRKYEDRYSSPGAPMLDFINGRYCVQQTSNGMVILHGSGASPNGDRPFMDWMDLDNDFSTKRIWRCTAGPTSALKELENPATEVNQMLPKDHERRAVYETLVKIIDDETIVISRESQNDVPNNFIRDIASGKEVPLTSFEHPQPTLLNVKKELITYKRADGVELDAELYLPPDYQKEDGPRPCLMWAYPREFKTKSAAGQVTTSPYRFVRTSWSRPLPWLVRGYCVVEKFAVPIIGEGKAEPNDTFVQQLVWSAEAAVAEVVKRGVAQPGKIAVGGHSYGGFMTAHLLAHTKLFCAGIARSGAYNRMLTPFGFQGEERTFWDAKDIYLTLSPFSHAKKIAGNGAPLLLIHGESDPNPGTNPLQSERLFAALKGLGAVSKLVMLPLEVHGYRAQQSIMHALYEQNEWLAKHLEEKVSEASPVEEFTEESIYDPSMFVFAFSWTICFAMAAIH